MDDSAVMSAADLEALRLEIERLDTVERPAIATRIKTAREWGDLKENSEYHDAKNDQAHLETRIKVLTDRLRRADVREPVAGADKIGFGSRVRLRDEVGDREVTYTLVASLEADARAGRLSYESPVAQALVGARVGDTVTVTTPRRKRDYAVLAID